jgi:YegS/Rv2252/BmrU family lipid kinase
MNAQKKKILFIINPISGGHNKMEIIQSIPKLLDHNKFDISFAHTKHAGHAAKIAKEAVDKNTDIIVAVGGDGTINEVASQLVNTNAVLAIVPCGSGNGLARDLGIPLHYRKTIQQINILKQREIDVGICNHQYFFSLTGAGFDAQVAYDFNRGKQRKFFGYLWSILKTYFKLKDQYYEVELENEKVTDKFFFVTIANSSQWGYNVKVAPNARPDDGVFSVNLCKKPPFLSLIHFGIKMLSGKIETSKYVTLKNSSKITITSKQDFYYHIDGEFKGKDVKQIEVNILYKALKILAN